MHATGIENRIHHMREYRIIILSIFAIYMPIILNHLYKKESHDDWRASLSL